MDQTSRAMIDDWLYQLSAGQTASALNESGIATLSSPAFPGPLYLVHPAGDSEVFVLVAQMDHIGGDAPAELLASLLALNAQASLSAGAFALDPADGTLLYRYVGELPGRDFNAFRNTVTNFGSLASHARTEYHRLRKEAPAPRPARMVDASSIRA